MTGRAARVTHALAMLTYTQFRKPSYSSSALVLAGTLLALGCLCSLLIEGVLILLKVISLVEVHSGFLPLPAAADLFRSLVEALGGPLCLYLWTKVHSSRASDLVDSDLQVKGSHICQVHSQPSAAEARRKTVSSAYLVEFGTSLMKRIFCRQVRVA